MPISTGGVAVDVDVERDGCEDDAAVLNAGAAAPSHALRADDEVERIEGDVDSEFRSRSAVFGPLEPAWREVRELP